MSLADKLNKKLEGGKFRLMNEKLYKNNNLTDKETILYHQYYSNQIKKWPLDPKNIIIEKILEKKHETMNIADLGCGDATLSQKFKNVTSYDKYPINEKIIKSDLNKIEAEDGQYDISVCCLSLMMTYITKAIKEMNRILKVDGFLYLAEVTSRIRNTKKFITDIEKFGFKLVEVDNKNSHFCFFIFKKVKNITEDMKYPTVSLNPCFYKKR